MKVGRLKGAHKVSLLERTALLTFFQKNVFLKSIFSVKTFIGKGKVLKDYYLAKYYKNTTRGSIKRLLFGKVSKDDYSAKY